MMTSCKLQVARCKSAILLILLLVGCGSPLTTQSPNYPTAQPTGQPTTLPSNQPPPPETTAAAFLDAWESGDYGAMYARLSIASQTAIDAESFTQRYQNALTNATVLTVTTRLQSALQEDDQAHVAYELTLDTALVGALITDTVMSLSLHAGQWWVDWDAGLIWPQLAGGRYFRMDYTVPVRANIYDRAGLGLATEGTIVTIGVIPGQVEDENALLGALALVTGLSPDEIRGRYIASPADWKAPIADIPAEVSVDHNDLLSSISGIYRDEKVGRIYPLGSIAPHVVGWVSPVPAEQLDAYRAQGYRGDEWVGVSGLEAWGEEMLAGRHGGALNIVTAVGERVTTVAEQVAVPSRAIYTTLDRDLQEQVQQILGGRKGAIVVLDVHSGAVLALASGPGFDSNAFVEPAGAVGRSQILADPGRPLFNRATQGTYPSASVFKIVTTAAALEEAEMHPDHTIFYCPGYWEGLGPASRKGCWKEEGHGDISLRDGLTASCDVVFYAVGQTLDGVGQDVIPRFGRGFGFGEKTGLDGVLEEGGLMPDPDWKVNTIGEQWWVGDTINIAIGQGYLLVTPLQVARMIAAVANGGTLYRPYVIQRIGPAGDTLPEQVTQPEAVGALPVSAEHLAAIQDALLGVTTKSIGTASHRFTGLSIPVAGKTGTAEVGGPDTEPHSWFAAYAPADNPEIAIVVLAENAGEGSSVAAPLTRQVVEAYYGLPLSPLPPLAEEDYAPPTPTPQP
ncbi:MAG: penicillin-binding protein 2 [Chloroflexi bacterium]|nr:MAG: penicillin-binding protein 2 [Chloroflexota bacterium]RLC85454.1 MAG: penicillin-binding protein 2 [Chloroflexota bacterium]